jgi:hypothetical protein
MAKTVKKTAEEKPQKKVGEIYEAYGHKYEVLEVCEDGVIVKQVD